MKPEKPVYGMKPTNIIRLLRTILEKGATEIAKACLLGIGKFVKSGYENYIALERERDPILDKRNTKVVRHTTDWDENGMEMGMGLNRKMGIEV